MNNKTITLNVLGFDPSLNNWGYSLGVVTHNLVTDEISLEITKSGVINPPKDIEETYKNRSDLIKASSLFAGILPLLSNVDVIASELPTGSQSARAMTSYGVCLGILSTLSSLFPKTHILYVNPDIVKLSTVGDKTATKSEMINWVVNNYPEVDFPIKTIKNISSIVEGKAEHMADSVAVLHSVLETITTLSEEITKCKYH